MSEEDHKVLEEGIERIKKAVAQGLSFEQALGILEIPNEEFRAAVADDALKVLIAEMHFMGKKPVAEVARALKLSADTVNRARAEMLQDVEASAIEAYKQSQGPKGTA